MVVFDRLIVVLMLALLIAAAIVLFVFYGGASQLQSFTSVRSICESSFASACFNTGKSPTTWDMRTQSANGTIVACSRMLNCTCGERGRNGAYECAPMQ